VELRDNEFKPVKTATAGKYDSHATVGYSKLHAGLRDEPDTKLPCPQANDRLQRSTCIFVD
jgi:hypothetical protein